MDNPENLGLVTALGIVTILVAISLMLIRRYNNRKKIESHQKISTPTIVPPQQSQGSTTPATALTKLTNQYENDIKEEIYRIRNLSPNQLESHCAKLTGHIDLHINKGSLPMKTCEDLKRILERERQAALAKFKTTTTTNNNNNNNNNNNTPQPKPKPKPKG